MTKRRARLYWLLLCLAALGIAAALTLYALRDNLAYFRTPSEIVSGAYPERGTGRAFRLGGLVEQGSLQHNGSAITFRVTDLHHELTVRYSGAVPDLFREGQGVVAEGKMGADHIFTAQTLLAKHDENYHPPGEVRALGPAKQGRGTMIPELGHFALILALLVSLLQGTLPLWGAARKDAALMALGTRAAYTGCGLILFAFAVLAYAHMTDDFSVLNVYMNSAIRKPMLYKFAGVWGSHEGSMLLWVLMLALYGAAMARTLRTLPPEVKARTLAVQGMMGFGFIAFILFTSNPFARLALPPLDGRGLNPLLQDPGLAFHPPFLYGGYVGFSSVFSLAAALLLSDWVAVPWAKWARPWALAAWSSLTLGIALGSWWAYYELGWGGWWFWDPVENAALLPWLAGTALLHSLLTTWQRGALARWTILLAIITFSLSMLGTFLVRSGVLTSVHSFAVDPTRGIAILGLLALTIGGALTLYAARAHTLPGSPMFSALSRESALLINNLLLCAAAATVLTGTLYPILLNALTGSIVSVGAPYFNTTVLPMLIPLTLLMATGPLIKWRRSEAAEILRQLRVAAAITLLAIVAALYLEGFKSALGLLAVACGAWVIGATATQIARNRSLRGFALGHLGVGVTLLGMAGSAFSTSLTIPMTLHQTIAHGGYRIEFAALNDVPGPNYTAERGTFYLWHDRKFLAMLQPERRFYPAQGMTLSNVSIRTNLMRDLYAAMENDATGDTMTEASPQRTLRLQINPLVPWNWLGAILMALGGISAIWPQRRITAGATGAP